MRQLRLMALSDDGAYLILADDNNEEFVLQADERLHAAIRGDRARLGQLEIQLESQLRPRDIQARVRAGESVESLAAMAGISLDKIERFAGPVLAERQHIAERARQANVRRNSSDGKVPTLEDAATQSAKAHGIRPEGIEWDAWRRDDGRWIVKCAWTVDGDDVAATFSFDPTGRSVTAEDDAARLLSGEVSPRTTPSEPEPVRQPEPEPAEIPPPAVADFPHEPEVTGPARLSVVPGERDEPRAAAAGDDVMAPAAPSTRAGTDNPRERRRSRTPEPWERDDVSADDEVTSERLRLSDIATKVQVEGPSAAEIEAVSDAPGASDEAVDEQPKPTRKSSKNKRPSVPSWDEIMFGRRTKD